MIADLMHARLIARELIVGHPKVKSSAVTSSGAKAPMRARLIAQELRVAITAAAGESWRWQLRDKDGQWIRMGSLVKWLNQGQWAHGRVIGSPWADTATVEDDATGNRFNVTTNRLTLDDSITEEDIGRTREIRGRITDVVTPPLPPPPSPAEIREANVDALATSLNQRALEIEPIVTKILQEITEQNGGRMAGLPFRFKEPKTIAKKIKNNTNKEHRQGYETTDEEQAAKIGDALRYTSVIDPSRNVDAAKQILAELEAEGHTVERVKNTWPMGDDYSGINVKMRAPNGLPWELQFHTEDSYQTKEFGTHADYEIYRDPDQPLTERAFAYLRMVKMWKNIEQPAGWEDFGEIIFERPDFR